MSMGNSFTGEEISFLKCRAPSPARKSSGQLREEKHRHKSYGRTARTKDDAGKHFTFNIFGSLNAEDKGKEFIRCDKTPIGHCPNNPGNFASRGRGHGLGV